MNKPIINKRIIYLVVSAILVSAFVLSPIPPAGKHGAYNTFSGAIWCEKESVCIHEVAHKLDHEGGWISRSKEFTLTVQSYLIVEFGKEHASELAWIIMERPGLFSYDGAFTDHHAEIYAVIFEYSRGVSEAMPERFRRFYDWERADELLKIYVRSK